MHSLRSLYMFMCNIPFTCIENTIHACTTELACAELANILAQGFIRLQNRSRRQSIRLRKSK